MPKADDPKVVFEGVEVDPKAGVAVAPKAAGFAAVDPKADEDAGAPNADAAGFAPKPD